MGAAEWDRLVVLAKPRWEGRNDFVAWDDTVHEPYMSAEEQERILTVLSVRGDVYQRLAEHASAFRISRTRRSVRHQ
jgi:hypothetical protein